MNLLKHRSMRFYLVFFLILTMAIGGSAIAAFADGGNATANVTGGTLSESTNINASVSAALNGSDQTKTYSFSSQVTDPTGGGAGWRLQISANPLLACTNCTGINPTPTLTQQISSSTASCPAGSNQPGGNSCTNASPSTGNSQVNYPVVIIGTAKSFYSAAANTGMGIDNVTTNVDVLIPGNAYAGSYSSTLSVISASGP